ncbi:MAG: 3-deoxy-8-phosphooctulonate synthase [Bdellovibrio sp.]|nr:3-deoxy-8-phosphooctulonate synthase [Bdellovibrio sp.]
MTVIMGPCVIEDPGMVYETAAEIKRQLSGLPIRLYFKASFDKANRSSIEGFRGPGLKQGLKILDTVRSKTGLPILTDFHTPDQADAVAECVDFLQVPAFLCRQTDMIEAAAKASIRFGRRLNIKKGQFLAPWDAKNIVEKIRSVESKLLSKAQLSKLDPEWFCITERGTSFGYNTLVVDMIAFQTIQRSGVSVIYDATHSIQTPGGGVGGKSTGGKRENLEVLARAAMAAGANGVFVECHPEPAKAKSDGPNAFYLDKVGPFVRQLLEIRSLVSGLPLLLPESHLGAEIGRSQNSKSSSRVKTRSDQKKEHLSL